MKRFVTGGQIDSSKLHLKSTSGDLPDIYVYINPEYVNSYAVSHLAESKPY